MLYRTSSHSFSGTAEPENDSLDDGTCPRTFFSAFSAVAIASVLSRCHCEFCFSHARLIQKTANVTLVKKLKMPSKIVPLSTCPCLSFPGANEMMCADFTKNLSLNCSFTRSIMLTSPNNQKSSPCSSPVKSPTEPLYAHGLKTVKNSSRSFFCLKILQSLACFTCSNDCSL